MRDFIKGKADGKQVILSTSNVTCLKYTIIYYSGRIKTYIQRG